MIQRSSIKTQNIFTKYPEYNKDRSIIANIFSTDIETDW